MQWAVWITVSDGTRYRFGVYDNREEADGVAALVGGVVELVAFQPANRRAFFRRAERWEGG